MQGLTRRELILGAAAGPWLRARAADDTAFLPLEEARPVLDSFANELPQGFAGRKLTADSWLAWETIHDREIRARLKRGDADSIFNLALFGTSFTAQPRVTTKVLEGGDDRAAAHLILARVRDLAAAASHPGSNERVQFAADWLKENGVDPAQPADAKRVEALLLENALRVRREQRDYAKAIAVAKQQGDAASLFVTRSSLYRDRGLSLDTSFRPNYAIEQALGEMKAAGVLRNVRRAAVIGPGLDFADKRSGYDFYPVQTLQPFALIDSLRKLKLADASGPAVEIFDLSERVLGHVRRAVERARGGTPYMVQVPLDGETRWLPQTVAYWRGFGAEIGMEAKPLDPPRSVHARMHAVRIRPQVVMLLGCADLDVVTQRRTPEHLDLAVATNILVYYSPFEQSLALRNIADMLRPAGILLSNNALPEVSGMPMKPVGSTTVAYSQDPDDGDRLIWYQRQ